jgi:hypothetical protein
LADEQQQFFTGALRQLLPQQMPVADVLNQLLQHLSSLQQNKALSPAFTTLLTSLVHNLPQADQLQDPQLLRRAVRDSGLFLEAKLVAGYAPPPSAAQANHTAGSTETLPLSPVPNAPAPTTQPQSESLPLPQAAPVSVKAPLWNASEIQATLQQDFKAHLLKIAVALPEQMHSALLNTEELPVLADMQHKINGALSHLVLEQLASLPQADTNKQVWFAEIPFVTPQGVETLKLEVEKDGRASQDQANDAQPAWAVTLTLTPPGLATVYCKISYQADSLNTYFWSEDPQALQTLAANKEQLRDRYADVGLSPGAIDVQKGSLQKTVAQRWAGQSLFEDKA